MPFDAKTLLLRTVPDFILYENIMHNRAIRDDFLAAFSSESNEFLIDNKDWDHDNSFLTAKDRNGVNSRACISQNGLGKFAASSRGRSCERHVKEIDFIQLNVFSWEAWAFSNVNAQCNSFPDKI